MTVVLCNGCFDPPHYGHLLHLKAAKDMGDRLIVSVTCDRSVTKEKGLARPVLAEQRRAEFLKALRMVDEVIIVPSVQEALRKILPDILVKGPDYSLDTIDDETKRICDDHNIAIRFTQGPKFSSTQLINELRRS